MNLLTYLLSVVGQCFYEERCIQFVVNGKKARELFFILDKIPSVKKISRYKFVFLYWIIMFVIPRQERNMSQQELTQWNFFLAIFIIRRKLSRLLMFVERYISVNCLMYKNSFEVFINFSIFSILREFIRINKFFRFAIFFRIFYLNNYLTIDFYI